MALSYRAVTIWRLRHVGVATDDNQQDEVLPEDSGDSMIPFIID